MTDPLFRVLLGFNVKRLPGIEAEAAQRQLPVFVDRVIYSLVEDYQTWLQAKKQEIAASQRVERIHPAKIRFLPGCSFRQRDPAVFGVRILAGTLMPGRMLIKDDGRQVGRIKSIQKENKTVQKAIMGDEVALSVPGPTIGRQIKEEDILYMEIPEGDARWLWQEGKLSTDEREVLEEVMRVKRKTERFWAM